MARERAPTYPDADSWEPVQLRMIAFCGSSPREVEQKWFTELTGEKPSNSAANLHERTDRGTYLGIDFSVAAELARVVLTASPKLPETAVEDLPPELPSLGPFGPTRDVFQKLSLKWLGGSHPPITRLAFAGRLVQRAKNDKAATRLLGNYLHALKIDRNSGDLMYRINRRRKSGSGIRDLEINRLATWSAMQVIMQATPVLSTGIQTSAIAQSVSHMACLDLDINTVPVSGSGAGALPDNRLIRLFKELTDLGSEIAAKGDVR